MDADCDSFMEVGGKTGSDKRSFVTCTKAIARHLQVE